MKPTRLALISAALVSVLAAEAVAGVYKWVDKDGRVKYGDQPPPDETAQSREINTSGVPLALQARLRQLDRSFSIKRITGNLDIAWVCLEFSTEEGREPDFVSALRASNLGTIEQASMVQNNVDYDDDGNVRYRRGRNERCPEHQASRSDMRWKVYEVHFDSKAVDIYRGAP